MRNFRNIKLIFSKIASLDYSMNLIRNNNLNQSDNFCLSHSQNIENILNIRNEIILDGILDDLFEKAKKENLSFEQKESLKQCYHFRKTLKLIPINLLKEFYITQMQCNFHNANIKKEADLKNLNPKLSKLISLLKDISIISSETFNCSKYSSILKLNFFESDSAFIEIALKELGRFIKKHFDYITKKKDFAPLSNKNFSLSKKHNLASFLSNNFKIEYNENSYQHYDILKEIFDISESNIITFTKNFFKYLGHNEGLLQVQKIDCLSILGGNNNNIFVNVFETLYTQYIFSNKDFLSFFIKKINKVLKIREQFFNPKIITDYPKFINITPNISKSDDLTYLMHIMFRYSVEKELLDGNLTIKDLPEFWNIELKYYLGITEINPNRCYIDKYICSGNFGYIPNTLISNFIAFKVHQNMLNFFQNSEEKLSQGNLEEVKNFIRSNTTASHIHKILFNISKSKKIVSDMKNYLTNRFELN